MGDEVVKKGKKILIVDDSPNVLKLLNISLSKAGYDIVMAENGEVAFELANREHPDLIISDVMMPQMDGLELVWMIRESSEIPLVPFIFLTSFDDSEMEVRGFRAGADEYLNKPVDRKLLLEHVENLLNRGGKLKSIESTTEENKGFSGDLADLSIVELVQMLNLNKKSGVLDITSDEGSGLIYLKDGQLYGAKTRDKEGEEAFYDLVGFTKGRFNFEIADSEMTQNINGGTMNVLMEACRIMDEKRHSKEEN